MVADAARSHSTRTGSSIEGAYFGVNSFAMKLAVSTANLAFPSFLLLGRSAERSLGIRLSGAAAAVLTLAGYLVLRRYEEVKEA
jgi:Na+/melibiose symporter-like transporter